MATYYYAPRPQSVSRTSSTRDDPPLILEPGQAADSDTAVSADHPIYIFPSPASQPPTPGTSVSSAPTDFEFSYSSESWSTSRTRLGGENFVVASRRESSSSAGNATYDASLRYGDLPTPFEDDSEVEIELWEASDDPVEALSESDGSWVLHDEEEHQDATPVHYMSTAHSGTLAHRSSMSSQRPPDMRVPQYRVALRSRRRSRTSSRLRTTSVSTSGPASASQTAPHPTIHIPLLSFFASLLSMDLDDPALRLLSAAEPEGAEAVLFPGHSSARLLSEAGNQEPTCRHSLGSMSDGEEDESSFVSNATLHGEPREVHGLPKLLLASISDTSTVALHSLRAGLAVRLHAASDFALPRPRPTELFGLWRVLGDVCSRGSQAWKEVWAIGSAPGLDIRTEDT
ncbi:hypothetical protein BV20DRAFT_964194 [Pilatotrama ljubarskyi]|nr:hypothetical protein BV20DRAFT_964194 [Pilatotrama ljubarskyi]